MMSDMGYQWVDGSQPREKWYSAVLVVETCHLDEFGDTVPFAAIPRMYPYLGVAVAELFNHDGVIPVICLKTVPFAVDAIGLDLSDGHGLSVP